MRTFHCQCNSIIFFDNSQCMKCKRELGFCPICRRLVALIPQEAGHYSCCNADCGATLAKCLNYSQDNVCNRCVAVSTSNQADFCDCCRFNATIPDLQVPGNWEKWRRLEAAKRRLFYTLSVLGLPYGTKADGIEPGLAFDFKADVIPAKDIWRGSGQGEKVFTGHDNGRITINIREADSVLREKLRVEMRETHRSLIGHFRHEIGHYYWDLLVKSRREDESRATFGDHDNPNYDDVLASYYKSGPPQDWPERFVSAYATMHPWEDFAETWAAYLDLSSTLETAESVGLGGESDPIHADLDAMLIRYQQLGVAFNEINRNMGLLDVVPQIFVQPVIDKLRFVHSLVLAGRSEDGALSNLVEPIGRVGNAA